MRRLLLVLLLGCWLWLPLAGTRAGVFADAPGAEQRPADPHAGGRLRPKGRHVALTMDVFSAPKKEANGAGRHHRRRQRRMGVGSGRACAPFYLPFVRALREAAATPCSRSATAVNRPSRSPMRSRASRPRCAVHSHARQGLPDRSRSHRHQRRFSGRPFVAHARHGGWAGQQEGRRSGGPRFQPGAWPDRLLLPAHRSFLNYGDKDKYAFAIDGTLAGFRMAVDVRAYDPKTKRLEHITDEKKIHELARQISPVTHVTANSAPSLIIHGDADKLVPIQQAEVFVAAMEKASAVAKLVVKRRGRSWLGRHGQGSSHPDGLVRQAPQEEIGSGRVGIWSSGVRRESPLLVSLASCPFLWCGMDQGRNHKTETKSGPSGDSRRTPERPKTIHSLQQRALCDTKEAKAASAGPAFLPGDPCRIGAIDRTRRMARSASNSGQFPLPLFDGDPTCGFIL